VSEYVFTQAHWRGCVVAMLVDEFQLGRLFAAEGSEWPVAIPFPEVLADVVWMTSWEGWGADA
jgi:hypothetical protein